MTETGEPDVHDLHSRSSVIHSDLSEASTHYPGFDKGMPSGTMRCKPNDHGVDEDEDSYKPYAALLAAQNNRILFHVPALVAVAPLVMCRSKPEDENSERERDFNVARDLGEFSRLDLRRQFSDTSLRYQEPNEECMRHFADGT